MKRAVVFFLFIFVCTLSSAWAKTEAIMVNHKEAKIRNGPGTEYTVLWRPRLYTPLEVLARYKEWYAVRDSEADVGWIHKSGIQKKKGAIITGKYLNVRSDPSLDARILFQAPKNYTFKVVETKKEWYRVKDPDGDEGWVFKKGVWDGTKPPKIKKKAKEKKK
jgi:SH3-like domain-containing protein